jgi:flagellar basal body-associated protein FliL
VSQVSMSACPSCHTPVGTGQPYCPRCGAKLISTGNTVAPTQNASSGSWQSSAPGQINAGGVAPTMAASSGSWQPESGGNNYNAAPPPPAGLPNSTYGPPSGYPASGYDPYAGSSQMGSSTPPPPPTDPYAAPAPANPYAAPGQPGQYMQPPYMPGAKKKSSTLYIVLGIVLAVLVVCGGSTWAISKALNPGSSNTGGGGSNNSGGQFAASQNVNLQVIYASDQITFTSIKQASKFSDDSFTGLDYENNKNYVRVSFNEKQLSDKTSYFSYDSAFTLILPDKSTAKAIQAEDIEGPEGGVVRTNWVDFELNKQVDLSQLSLLLGASDEAQMTFPLKTGADVSKYNPQKITPNQAFQYASMNWTLNDVTQSYYNNGQQAKSGKVIVIVDLTANNPSSSTVYLDDSFIRLKSGTTVSAPNFDSNLTNFDIVDPGTTNIQGTAVFDTPPASSYTLEFASGQNIAAQSLDFTIGSGS